MLNLEPKNDIKLNNFVKTINEKIHDLEHSEINISKINDTVKKMENYMNFLNSKKSSSKDKQDCNCQPEVSNNSEIMTLVEEIKKLTSDVRKLADKVNQDEYLFQDNNCENNYDKCEKMSNCEKTQLQKICSRFIRNIRNNINDFESKSNQIFNKKKNTFTFNICGQCISISF